MSKKSSQSGSTLRAVLTSNELAAYRLLIDRLARGSVNQRIPNGHPMHAAILMESMFENARNDMRIFSGQLAGETYDQPELIDAACRFLERPGARLRILLQDTLPIEELARKRLVVELAEKNSRRLGAMELRTATGVYASGAAKHFAVMDDRGFRFEVDHPGTQAIANFNEQDAARDLSAAFDAAFRMAKPVICPDWLPQ